MTSSGQFLAGFAEVDITPTELPLVAGYYHERRATGVHDRLMARSMAISDGETLADAAIALLREACRNPARDKG